MCGSCQFVQSLPIIAILGLVAYTYYVYVYELCILLIEENFKMIAYLIVYHLLLIPFLVMYFFTMCHKEWYVPANYYFPMELYDRINKTDSDDAVYSMLVSFCKSRNIRVYTRNATGSIRVCHSCKLLKPDRAHHCSTCQTCVIKMDHHCPWVNNCIGFTNYKYFLILVIYSGILCTYYWATTFEYTLNFFFTLSKYSDLRRLHIVISNFILLILAIILWCLLGFHINLILINETTIEAMHPPTFSRAVIVGYDQGKLENWKEICTLNCCLWFLPVQTVSGNGVEFDVMRYA